MRFSVKKPVSFYGFRFSSCLHPLICYFYLLCILIIRNRKPIYQNLLFFQLSVNNLYDILFILYIFVSDQNRPPIRNLNEEQKPCIHR